MMKLRLTAQNYLSELDNLPGAAENMQGSVKGGYWNFRTLRKKYLTTYLGFT